MNTLGLSRYNKFGDVVDTKYQLSELKTSVFSPCKIITKDKLILDVGCGNGRIWNLCQDAKLYIGLDKEMQIDRRWFENTEAERKVTFIIGHSIFDDIIIEKFDYILFIGSFYLHYNYGYLATLKRAMELLNENGRIVIMENSLRILSKEEKFGYYDLCNLCSKANLIIHYFSKINDRYSYIYIGKV